MGDGTQQSFIVMLSRKKKAKMLANLGFYWTRRRETCIELLNKFRSFQLAVCCCCCFCCCFWYCWCCSGGFFFDTLLLCACTLIKSLLLYYMLSDTQPSNILLGWAHFMWISYSTSSSRFIYQDFFFPLDTVSFVFR